MNYCPNCKGPCKSDFLSFEDDEPEYVSIKSKQLEAYKKLLNLSMEILNKAWFEAGNNNLDEPIVSYVGLLDNIISEIEENK